MDYKKILKSVVLSGIMLFVMAGSAEAVTTTVDISDLPEYTNTDTFYISYTAIANDPSAIKAQFYYQKEGESEQAFGPQFTGPSNEIQVTGSQINEDGKSYTFKVKLIGEIGSDETSIKFDRSGPGQVSNYWKERVGLTTYRLHWRNEGDDDAATIFIYRGESADFSANDDKKVGGMAFEKDKDITYDDTGVDPNKDYYYLIRVLDKAGNSSALVGDASSMTVTDTTVTTTGEGGAETEVRQYPAEGQVLGEEEGDEGEEIEETELEEEKTFTETVADTVEEIKKNKNYIWALGGIVLLGALYYRFFVRKKE